MPDTGAPWNIPYVAGTDLVADWPTDSQTLAEAIADGLDAAGGLVAVKHAIFQGTQTNSTAAGAFFAITDLTITHTLADAANKLIVSAYVGAIASSEDKANVGIALADDGTIVGAGTTAGNRTSIAAGGHSDTATAAFVFRNNAFTFVYEPGDTASHVYTLRATNLSNTTATVYINRSEGDSNLTFEPRASSALVIQEVKV